MHMICNLHPEVSSSFRKTIKNIFFLLNQQYTAMGIGWWLILVRISLKRPNSVLF